MRRGWLGWVLVALLAACGGDGDFDAAARANTIAAWEVYLRAHPDGRHSAEVRARITELREPDDWRKAHALETVAGYQQYLGDHANGAHAHDALVAIAGLNLGAAPVPAAPSSGSPRPPVAVPPPVAAPPAPTRAPTRAPAATSARNFRIQLGAYSGPERVASDAWQRLQAQHPQLVGRVPLISLGRTGDGRSIQRLQVAGFDRPDAEATCRALNAAGVSCVIIKADPVGGR